MGFAERLKGALSDAGLTQRELAAECGVTCATISRYVSGKRKPGLMMLMRLKQALGCTYEELVEGEFDGED